MNEYLYNVIGYMCVYYHYMHVYTHNICTAIRLSLWNILQETFFCKTIENFCKSVELDAPWKNTMDTWYVWWLLYATNRHALYLPPLGVQPCWRALATEMLGRWTLATPPQGSEHLREVLQTPKQSSAVLFKIDFTIISTITSTIAATTTYLTD